MTGAAISTVIKRRTTHGHASSAPRRPRSDIGAKRPHLAPNGRVTQPYATAAAKLSPLAGRGPGNVHAVAWHLIAPDGTSYEIRNLYEFVRTHPHLFAPADVEWKRLGGERGKGGEWCNATAGILNVKGGRAKSWKGWRVLR